MALTALHRFNEEDLNPGEVIIYRAHLNFIAFLLSSKFFILSLAVGIAILVISYLYRETIGFLIDGTITVGVVLFASGFLLWGGIKFFYRFIDWLYDEDIITNQRVIDYNQKFLFSKDLTTASMKSIENIILVQKGFIQTFFDFGTLDVQTSASVTHARPGEIGQYLVLNDISRPRKIQQLIDEIAYRVKKEVEVDPDEVLIKCGLKKGSLEEYFVVKKTKGWQGRVKKLMNW
ncbi:MAG: hypothetical protein AB7J40_05940 [Candidatus Altimarinota bacterium]